MPDAPPEPEIIDMPPAPASARLMSNLELYRIALGVQRWTALMSPKTITTCIKTHRALCCLTCPLSRVYLFCVSCPGFPDSDKVFFFFFSFRDGLKKSCHTR